jgi:hypothetical protein
LSSQKTPAHHHTPRGELPGLSTTVHPPRSIGSQGVPVRGAASGPVDRASRARSVRRLADNQKVTPRYPASSNHPPNTAPPTITPGQTPTHAAKPRLTAGFGHYDCGHSTPPEAATPTTHQPPHHRSPAVLGCKATRSACPPCRAGRWRARHDPEERARHLERRRLPSGSHGRTGRALPPPGSARTYGPAWPARRRPPRQNVVRDLEPDIDRAATNGVRASGPAAPHVRRAPARSPGASRPP